MTRLPLVYFARSVADRSAHPSELGLADVAGSSACPTSVACPLRFGTQVSAQRRASNQYSLSDFGVVHVIVSFSLLSLQKLKQRHNRTEMALKYYG